VSDLVGVDPSGRTLRVPVVGTRYPTLLLFLSSSCDGCAVFWSLVADPGRPDLVPATGLWAVTRSPGAEDAAAVARLAGGGPVVLADAAWSAYRVHGPPFFALCDGRDDRVVTEGVAWSPDQVASHCRAALAGRSGPEVPRLEPPADGPHGG
jgi:hypothetical protein